MYSRCQMEPISHASSFFMYTWKHSVDRPCALHTKALPLAWPPQIHNPSIDSSDKRTDTQKLGSVCVSDREASTEKAPCRILITSTLAVPPNATKSMPASESAGCCPLYTRVERTSPELK